MLRHLRLCVFPLSVILSVWPSGMPSLLKLQAAYESATHHHGPCEAVESASVLLLEY